MKTNKIKNWFLAAAAIAVATPALAGEREGTGGAGVRRNGVLVPADAYYRKPAPAPKVEPKLDPSARPFALDAYPRLAAELSGVKRFFSLRNLEISFEPLKGFESLVLSRETYLEPSPGEDGDGKITAKEHEADRYRVVLVDRLDCEDKLPTDGTEVLPIACVYRELKAVELKADLFAQLAPRDQALFLVHELLHVYGRDHDYICPVLADARELMAVADRQLQEARDIGMIKPISESEYETSLELQRYIGGSNVWSSGLSTRLDTAIVDRMGGGLITGSLLDDYPRTKAARDRILHDNVVDLNSALRLSFWKLEDAIAVGQKITGNVLLNSIVEIQSGSVIGARFEGSNLSVRAATRSVDERPKSDYLVRPIYGKKSVTGYVVPVWDKPCQGLVARTVGRAAQAVGETGLASYVCEGAKLTEDRELR